MVEFYFRKLSGRMFIKNDKDYPKYGVGGLRYRSEQNLSKLYSLDIFDSIIINGDKITRVK